MGQFIRNVRELGEIVSALQSQGKKVVYTCGIWDVVHVGQIRALHDAKSRGHYLVAGVHTDASAAAHLDGGRPFLNEKERVEFVQGLADVDYVILSDAGADESVLEDLQACILATGVDTSLTLSIDKKCVTKAGGKVCAISSRRGPSIEKLIARYQAGAAAAKSKSAKPSSAKSSSAKSAATKTKAAKTKTAKAGGTRKKAATKVAARKTAAKRAPKSATTRKKTTKAAATRSSKKKAAAATARGKAKKTTRAASKKSRSSKRKPELVGAN